MPKQSLWAPILTTELTVENERQLVKRLMDLVADRARREQEIESRHSDEMTGEQQQYQQVFQLLTENYESEFAAIQQARTTGTAAIEERWRTETATVQERYDQVLGEIEQRWQAEKEAAQKERDEAGWLLGSLLDGDTSDSPRAKLQALQSGLMASKTELDTALKTLDGWYRTSTVFLQKCRLLGEVTTPAPSTLPLDQLSLHQTCVEAMRQAEPIQRRLMGRFLPRLFRGVLPVLMFLLCAGSLSALIWLLVPPSLIGLKIESTAQDWLWISAGAGSAIGVVALFLLHLYAGHLVLPDFDRLLQLSVDADVASQRWGVVSQRDYDQQEAELHRLHEAREIKREAAIAHSDSKLNARMNANKVRYSTELNAAQSTYPARLSEIQKILAQELNQFDAQSTAAQNDLRLRREQDFRNLQAEFDQRVMESRQAYQQSWGQLIRDWQSGLREIGDASDQLVEVVRRNCPKWTTVLGGWLESKVQPESTEPQPTDGILTVGRVVTDLATIPGGLSTDQRLNAERTRFEFPVLLSLAEKPSLVVRSRSDSRDQATRLLQTAMLRFLTSLPPGKVRFTIFDPVGLGANFASFMHLTDIDEQMVTSRIWTEPAHLEKRLADVTEHMENVLQTYLRNEYASLDDYNREAGEVAEPYRILVVANFPANFTEVALRRLVSIAEGGVKCGVFVLLSVDESHDLPRGFSLADIERHATVLRLASTVRAASRGDDLKDLSLVPTSQAGVITTAATSSAREAVSATPSDLADLSPFRLADPVLGDWPLMIDPPPPADEFGQIVRRAGQLARSVRRVEVPFERVMPPADAFWTSSTKTGLDIPIGRAGATKLQNLRLGKGTSQHVLIAGKTGSGKSSLLHALITNAALHYSPDEVEFYLIDFKKGVEFKTYATHRLPHARVIAIESDREFGVSVLQRLDTVLKDRGELFRRVGVQDLAGFREACPDQPLPRVLLVIDEFQEFFIEDDSLSQSAALLFDRLIRQGRAFGIHVLLGSQTLAGAYSLARSTLGQIAVRIALQCSDTDAHLILSEDNTAARLLSRPGEAIYNDANGLVEGNHPFQVVWLDDARRETYLGWMHPWADEFHARHGGPPIAERWPDAVVFEGNLAADPIGNPGFLAAAHRLVHPQSAAPAPVRSCWLGEAVALTGPTELKFGLRDGGPMLVVGRDEDAALGVLSSSVLALAGAGRAQFVVLDGSLPDSLSARTWRALAELIPGLKVVGPRDSAAALQEVVDAMHARQEDLGEPMFVIGFDLARFRDLRKSDDEFGGFGGFDKPKTVSPAALFSEIVKDGPAAGVFPFVWCDGYQSAQRWLGRELLGRFEVRVLFAMNANDSSNLIDSPAAGRLGPNRALLFRGDLGTLDKFRPYKSPSPGWLQELRHEIAASPETSAGDPVSASEPLNGSRSEATDTHSAMEPENPGTDSDPEDTWTDIGELNVN
ncbi:MAG: cell division protein FtsK [Planctomycetes bacterium]|nr:cell division protein FtsK [Planctomycetota bacterium]